MEIEALTPATMSEIATRLWYAMDDINRGRHDWFSINSQRFEQRAKEIGFNPLELRDQLEMLETILLDSEEHYQDDKTIFTLDFSGGK